MHLHALGQHAISKKVSPVLKFPVNPVEPFLGVALQHVEMNCRFREHHAVGFAFIRREMPCPIFPVVFRKSALRVRAPFQVRGFQIESDMGFLTVGFATALDESAVQWNRDIIPALGARGLDFLEGRIFDMD